MSVEIKENVNFAAYLIKYIYNQIKEIIYKHHYNYF